MVPLLLLVLSACANVPIIDHAFYGDFGDLGASEFHFLTQETHNYDKPTWDKMRFGMICEEPDVFADWKSVIEKLCSISNKCTWEQQQALKEFYNRVQTIQEKAGRR